MEARVRARRRGRVRPGIDEDRRPRQGGRRASRPAPAPIPASLPKSFDVEDLLAQATPRVETLLAQARGRIAAGDIHGAREILEAPETATSGALTFMLAETYDPNMLASWQTRGIIANPERARALYQKARDLGDGRAQQRLDWLTGN